jgi:hypothetical protein
MSLQPRPNPPVPHDTARVARAAFPRGNPYLRLRDELGTVFGDDDFADLYPRRGQPALPPWRLALVTVLQFREDLSDRRAADAVRAVESRSGCARKAWERRKRLYRGNLSLEPCGVPTPARQSLASGRKRVLRGARVTGTAKRRQRVSGPCH